MADEGRFSYSLNMEKTNLSVIKNAQYTFDLTGANGPTPGTISVTTSEVAIDLSALTTPAIVEFKNLDATNYVEIGAYISTTFYPLFEILPGESYIFRYSRNLTASQMRIRANTATCNVSILAYEA